MTDTLPRILVVEDEALLAIGLEIELSGAGYKVAGPCASVAQALDVMKSGPIDAAVIDVNLSGDFVFPLADHLIGRGTPFVLLSGYDEHQLPERYRRLPRLAKPHLPETLFRMIDQLLAAVVPARA